MLQQSQTFRDLAGNEHAVADCFAVSKTTITCDDFESVTDRVSKVQDTAREVVGTLKRLAFVTRNDRCLEGTMRRDEQLKLPRLKRLWIPAYASKEFQGLLK